MFTLTRSYIDEKYLIYLSRKSTCTYNFSCDAYTFLCEKPRYALLIKVKQQSLNEPEKFVNQKGVAKSFIEQTLLEKGLDPAKYRISNSEFNAAIGMAQLSLED
jgi:hypothetical protein